MRPRFTVGNLLLVMVIVALLAQGHRYRLKLQALEEQLTLHRAVATQIERIRQRELELEAVRNQILPDLQMAEMYRFTGLGDSWIGKLEPSDSVHQIGFELSAPMGLRRNLAMFRNAELQLAHERAHLEELQKRLRIQEQHGGSESS